MSTQVAEPEFLIDSRANAKERQTTIQMPQFRGTPGWEFTEIPKLDLASFLPANDVSDASAAAADAKLHFTQISRALVQVDQTPLPVTGEAKGSDGVVLCTLDQAARDYPQVVEKYLGKIESSETPFTVLNDSEWSGGFFVYAPAGAVASEPVRLSLIQTQAQTTCNSRTLIVVEEQAQVEIWSEVVSSGAASESEALLNGVVEIFVGDGATARFVDVQECSEKTWIFGAQRATVQRDGNLDWVTLGLGGGKGKVFQETSLDGVGAHGRVTGGYATRNRQHLDFDTLQTHAAAKTTSDLSFRGVLANRSRAVWRGMIKVDEGAQQTDAFQESRNLLLTNKSHADAIPGLEIAANDVACTHAAAIAQIDPEQLFYLQSRGIAEPQAQRLVIEGFLAELVTRFEEGPIRDRLAELLEDRMNEILGE